MIIQQEHLGEENVIKKRTLKGIVLSLLLHLFILLLFFVSFPKIKVPPPSGKTQKISLNLSQFKTAPPPAPKPVVPPQPKPVPTLQPPVPKPLPKPVKKPVEKPVKKPIEKSKPVMKKKLVDDKQRLFVEKSSKENNVTKPAKKEEKKKLAKKEEAKKKVPKKKVVKKKVVKKKKPVKKVAKRKPVHKKKRSHNPLANALMGSGNSLYPSSTPASSGSSTAKMINQLYGKEFNTYSATQKKFIRRNLGVIHRITQETLWRNGYPETAKRTMQQGTNVVSFYLHPNGDISGLHLKREIGYASLDRNTLEVIKIAYKDYPLPNQKTKIVFYVQYSIY